MKHIRGIVFDLDGTLLDTLETLAAAHNEALARHGHPPRPVDAYRYYIGNGARKCVERSLPQDARDDATIDAVTASFKVIYDDAWRRGTQPYEGIPELVTRLRERGYALAVLSNKDHPFTQKIIEHFFDDGTFDAVQGHSDAVPHKPSPVGIRHIADTLDLPLSALTLVGDTRVDMETAVAAGIDGVGATWGFRDAAELTEAGATCLIDHPVALCSQLGIS